MTLFVNMPCRNLGASGPWREIKRRVDSFAAPEGGGVGGSGVFAGVVEYVRFVLGRRRRQTNGCLGFVTAMLSLCDFCGAGCRGWRDVWELEDD